MEVDDSFFDEVELTDADLSKAILRILDVIDVGTNQAEILMKIGAIVQNLGFVD